MNRSAQTYDQVANGREALASLPARERISAVPTMKQRLLSSIAKPSTAEPAMVRLAECEHLPLRVREVLQGLLKVTGTALESSVAEALNEFEKQLVRLADKAPNEQQNGYFDSVHELKRGRADVMPRFMRSIESSLAQLGQDIVPANATPKPMPTKLQLALTESTHLDESLVLSDIANKVELRIREPLYTFGNRFGALAGTPRIATETVPLGPRSLVEALRYGTARLDLVLEHRLTLYRCFERVVFMRIGTFYNELNHYLGEQDILPEPHILSVRTMPRAAPDLGTSAMAGSAGSAVGRESVAIAVEKAANQAELSEFHSLHLRHKHPNPRPACLFSTLRQLLDECRRAETYTASGEDLQGVLVALQARQAAVAFVDNKPAVYTGEQIKHEILAVLRELSADGRTPRITEEDSDTIDLIAMLFEFLSRRAGDDSVSQEILVKLQIPILRVAFQDKSFFSQTQHPARQVLGNLIDVSGGRTDDAARNDPALVSKIQSVTNQIAGEYQGDVAVFHRALQDLSEQSAAIVRDTEQVPLIDGAWSAIADTLKYFSTHKLDNYFGISTLANRALDIHRQQMALRDISPLKQQTRTLLLVDDEENILRALKRVLRSDGYRILTATNARDGLELLRQNDVEVIICDQRMPEVSGTQFLGDVKEMYPDTVRIMLSGYSDAVSVTDAINRGTIYKFLTKPWNDEDIRQQVSSAFSAAEGRTNLVQEM